MQTVYIVGIVAAGVVIVGVVWLLRDRLTKIRIGASVSEKKGEAEFQAAPPRKGSSHPTPATPEKPPSVDISGNWMIGANIVRVLRDSVRVAKNRLLGKNRIEVKREPSRPAPTHRRKQKAKRRKR